jgi:signal transduction histidine kinase
LTRLERLEAGNDTALYEGFNLPHVIEEAVYSYRNEAERRSIRFNINTEQCPVMVIGDARKIRTIIQNLTGNARTCSFLPDMFFVF